MANFKFVITGYPFDLADSFMPSLAQTLPGVAKVAAEVTLEQGGKVYLVEHTQLYEKVRDDKLALLVIGNADDPRLAPVMAWARGRRVNPPIVIDPAKELGEGQVRQIQQKLQYGFYLQEVKRLRRHEVAGEMTPEREAWLEGEISRIAGPGATTLVIVGNVDDESGELTENADRLLSEILEGAIVPSAKGPEIQFPRPKEREAPIPMVQSLWAYQLAGEEKKTAGRIELYPINPLALAWFRRAQIAYNPPEVMKHLTSKGAQEERMAALLHPERGSGKQPSFGLLSTYPDAAMELASRSVASDAFVGGRQPRLIPLPSKKGGDVARYFILADAGKNDAEGQTLVPSTSMVEDIFYDLSLLVFVEGEQAVEVVMHTPYGNEELERFFSQTTRAAERRKERGVLQSGYAETWKRLSARNPGLRPSTPIEIKFLPASKRLTAGQYFGDLAPLRGVASERWTVRQFLASNFVSPEVLYSKYGRGFLKSATTSVDYTHWPPPPLLALVPLARLSAPDVNELAAKMRTARKSEDAIARAVQQQTEAFEALLEDLQRRVDVARKIMTLTHVESIHENRAAMTKWYKAVNELRRIKKEKTQPYFPLKSIVEVAAQGYGTVTGRSGKPEFGRIGDYAVASQEDLIAGRGLELAEWNNEQAKDLAERASRGDGDSLPPSKLPFPFAVMGAAIIDTEELKPENYAPEERSPSGLLQPDLTVLAQAREIAKAGGQLGDAYDARYVIVYGNMWGNRFYPAVVPPSAISGTLASLIGVEVVQKSSLSGLGSRKADFLFDTARDQDGQVVTPLSFFDFQVMSQLCTAERGTDYPQSRMANACQSIWRANERLAKKAGSPLPEREALLKSGEARFKTDDAYYKALDSTLSALQHRKVRVVLRKDIKYEAYKRVIRYGIGTSGWQTDPQEQTSRGGRSKAQAQEMNATFAQMRAGVRGRDFKFQRQFMPPSSIARLAAQLYTDYFAVLFPYQVNRQEKYPHEKKQWQRNMIEWEDAGRKGEAPKEPKTPPPLARSAMFPHASRPASGGAVEGAVNEDVLGLIARAGKSLPDESKFKDEDSYLAAVEKILQDVKDGLSLTYEHELPSSGVHALEKGGWEDYYKHLWTQVEEEDEDIQRSVDSMFSRLNPDSRQSRRERRERRPRRERQARQNSSFYESDEDDGGAYANPSSDLSKDQGLFSALFRSLDRVDQPTADEIQKVLQKPPGVTQSLVPQVQETFPRGKYDPNQPSLAARVSAYQPTRDATRQRLVEHDLVTRLAAQYEAPETRDLWQKANAFAQSPESPPDFWLTHRPAEGLDLPRALAEKAELSLPEAVTILKQQQDAKRRMTAKTVAASTALCQANRVRRLKEYRPPPALFDAAGSGGAKQAQWRDSPEKKIVLWMSPQHGPRGTADPEFRVMTFRRNTHIDCDMTATTGRTPLDVLSTAIQSALYWLAERANRRSSGAALFIGRIGDGKLYPVWRHLMDAAGKDVSPPLTVDLVEKSLRRMSTGEPGEAWAVPVSLNNFGGGYNAQADTIAYMRAEAFEMQRRHSRKGKAPPPRPFSADQFSPETDDERRKAEEDLSPLTE